MKPKSRLKLLKLLYTGLGLLTVVLVLLIAYLNERLVETIFIIILFYIYRQFYDKQYHCRSLFMCSIVSIISFAIISRITLSLGISILYSVIITFCVTTISYLVKDYLETKVLCKEYHKRLEKLTLRSTILENATEQELLDATPNIRKEVVCLVYGYLHRPKGQLAASYAYNNYISEATLYRYLKLVKDTYELNSTK